MRTPFLILIGLMVIGVIDFVVFPNQPTDEASSNPIFDFWYLPLPLIGLAILIWLCERKK